MFGLCSSLLSKVASNKKPKKEPEMKARHEEQSVKHRLATTLAAGFVFAVVSHRIYRRFFKRYPAADSITPDMYANKRWITGIVTSVGDGDGFRLYHTPVPFVYRWNLMNSAKSLSGQTIPIRLAGVDAPELAHFGRKAQPCSSEAQKWLEKRLLNKFVHCQLLKQDQYGRAIAEVKLPDTFSGRICKKWGTSINHEILRAGYAIVYTEKNAVYGPGGLEGHLAAEAEAKKRKKGQWKKGNVVVPPWEWRRRQRISARTKEEESAASGNNGKK